MRLPYRQREVLGKAGSKNYMSENCQRDLSDRRYRLLLGFVIAVAAVIVTKAVTNLSPGFDEGWHVFIAQQESLADLWHESTRSGHPPLYCFLLRLLSRFIPGTLIPVWMIARAISALCAVLSLVIFARLLRAIPVSRSWTIAGVIIWAISPAFLTTAVVARSYSLATLCIMAAALKLVEVFNQGRKFNLRDAELAFLFILLALGSHLSTLLFLAAITAPLLIVALLSNWRIRFVILLGGLGISGAAFVLVSFFGNLNLVAYGYLNDFLYRGYGGYGSFLWNTFSREAAILLPFSNDYSVVTLLMLAGMTIITIKEIVFFRQRPIANASVLVTCLPPILIGITALLALVVRYPFGGLARHQSMLMPFFAAGSVVVLERLITFLRPKINLGFLAPGLVSLIMLLASGKSTLNFIAKGDASYWVPEGMSQALGKIQRQDHLISSYLSGIALYGTLLVEGNVPNIINRTANSFALQGPDNIMTISYRDTYWTDNVHTPDFAAYVKTYLLRHNLEYVISLQVVFPLGLIHPSQYMAGKSIGISGDLLGESKGIQVIRWTLDPSRRL